MRIEYENKFSDILLFNSIHQFLSPPVQVLSVLLFGFIFWAESLTADLLASATTALLWYVAFWAFQFLFNIFYLFSKKNHSVLTKHVIEIQEEALLEETKFNKSYFYWTGVVKVVSRLSFVAVYVTPHLGHVVPNRAFASPQQRMDFITLIRKKLEVAKLTSESEKL